MRSSENPLVRNLVLTPNRYFLKIHFRKDVLLSGRFLRKNPERNPEVKIFRKDVLETSCSRMVSPEGC